MQAKKSEKREAKRGWYPAISVTFGEFLDLSDGWEVEYIPAIFVVGPKGVIRYTRLPSEKLEESVTEVLKEMEGKKGK